MKVTLEDISQRVEYPGHIFHKTLMLHNINFYELNEKSVLYDINDRILDWKSKMDVTISRVVSFYGDHVDCKLLEKVLHDVCRFKIFTNCSYDLFWHDFSTYSISM